MNFFRSILSEEPDPPNSPKSDDEPENDTVDDPDSGPQSSSPNPNPDPNPDSLSDNSSGMWSFGGLIKSLATQSDSVLETYRRDLQEFGSGLKKETDLFREVASRAVKELPASIEVAHGAIDGVIKSTAEIISQGKESILSTSENELDTPDTNRSLGSARYSRFESQLKIVQNDMSTFCEEPEDFEEFQKWKLEFVLEEMRGEISGLIGENGALEGVHKNVVPSIVDDETFWCRYYYRVNKLKLQENVRANLVRRAISMEDEEEELSWDVDDDEDDNNVGENAGQKGSNMKSTGDDSENYGSSNADVAIVAKQESSIDEYSNVNSKTDADGLHKGKVLEFKGGSVANENSNSSSEDIPGVKHDEEVKSAEGNGYQSESGKHSNFSVEPSQHSAPEDEEELGWDEIEDVESSDDKKVGTLNGSPNRAELRKRLSAAEEDEDLNWDIEDDDEPVKAKN